MTLTSLGKQAPYTICLVDDDDHVRLALSLLLGTYDFAVVDYPSARALLASSELPVCDCMVLDMHMPEMSGLELFTALRSRKIMTPTILLTGSEDAQLCARAKAVGVTAVLMKPISGDNFIEAVKSALYDPNP